MDLSTNLRLNGKKLIDKLDYVVYHMPFCNMAKKAHRHFIGLENGNLDETKKDRFFKETFENMEGALGPNLQAELKIKPTLRACRTSSPPHHPIAHRQRAGNPRSSRIE